MNNKKIAKELNNLARRILVSYKHELLRKNDTDLRNQSQYDMVTTYAPALTKAAINNIKKYADGNVDNARALSTAYLHYRNEDNNNNKYHFYAVLMLDVNGETKYAGINMYGRVGRIENFQLLSKGLVDNVNIAENAVKNHKYSKLSKGYQEIKLRRGSKRR